MHSEILTRLFWAVRYYYMRFYANILKILLPITTVLFSCTEHNDEALKEKESISDSISAVNFIDPGKLVVLMSNNISSYYIFKGQPRGFEYEMLKLFCKDNKLELKIKVIKDFDFILDSLESGKGDIAAGNITVTKTRKNKVDFSPEVLRTRQVLVQRLPKNYKKLSRKQRKARMLQDALDLEGKTVYVNAGSSFYARLKNYASENGINVEVLAVSSDLGTDELVNMVANGEIDYTVVDENIARIHSSILKNIDISVPISLSQSIAWAIPKEHSDLKLMLQKWLEERKNSTRYNIIYNKYFGSKSQLRNSANYASISDGRISRYDELIKKHAEIIEWDWLLLAAIINKESRFNPSAKSSFGATGLMQLMPLTAQRFGVDSSLLTNADANIRGGTRFLSWLEQFWANRLEDSTQIVYFILASYNAGPGHVLDAMALAEKYGLNSQIWHGHVEVMMRNKAQPKFYRDPVVKHGYCNGLQPVSYVTRVIEFFEYYKAFERGKSRGSPQFEVAVQEKTP